MIIFHVYFCMLKQKKFCCQTMHVSSPVNQGINVVYLVCSESGCSLIEQYYKHGLVLNLAFRINYSVHFWWTSETVSPVAILIALPKCITDLFSIIEGCHPPPTENRECKQSKESKEITDLMIVISRDGWSKCQQICAFVLVPINIDIFLFLSLSLCCP